MPRTLLILLTLLLGPSAAHAQTSLAPPVLTPPSAPSLDPTSPALPTHSPFALDHLVLRFAPAPPECAQPLPDCWPETQRALTRLGVTALTRLIPERDRPPHAIDRIYIAHIDLEAHPDLTPIAALPGIEVVEHDAIGRAAALEAPNDTAFGEQWGLDQLSDADIDATFAFALERGEPSVILAVLDTGVALDNLDFSGHILPGKDFANQDDDPSDDHGHGTNIAGLATAASYNGFAIAGVCGGCTLLPVKVLDRNNYGLYTWWIQGIEYAVEQGAQIINLSLGGENNAQTLEDAVLFAHDRGVLVVAATMNEGARQPFYPAAYDTPLAVGATNAADQRAPTFSWGGGSNYGSHIDLVAPGNRMLGPDGFTWSGTSQATAIASGAAGLLLSADPSLTPEALAELLTQSAEDGVGSPLEDTPGFDIYHGHGRLNIHRALERTGAFTDADGDGYSAPVDCDDTRSDIFPENIEIAGDGIDNDCNPASDDDDLDGDGFSPPRDCDDTRISVYPGALERPFNEIDDDCDPNTLDGVPRTDIPDPPKRTPDPGCCSIAPTRPVSGLPHPGLLGLFAALLLMALTKLAQERDHDE